MSDRAKWTVAIPGVGEMGFNSIAGCPQHADPVVLGDDGVAVCPRCYGEALAKRVQQEDTWSVVVVGED